MAIAEGVLATELATFDKEKSRLVGEAEGKYVAIKGEEILGIYSDERSALAAAYAKYGNVPFLVKRIALFEAPANFVSNTLGLTDANIQCPSN